MNQFFLIESCQMDVGQVTQIRNEAEKLCELYDRKMKDDIDAVVQKANVVGKAWCKSMLGYHASVYYENFLKPPPGAHFDSMWGMQERFSNSTVGEWVEYDYEEVADMIFDVIGSDRVAYLKTTSSKVSEEYIKLKSRIAEELEVGLENNPYLQSQKEKISKLRLFSHQELIRAKLPAGKILSSDHRAIQGGFVVPPHEYINTYMAAIENLFDKLEQLKNIAGKIVEHNQKSTPNRVGSTSTGKHVFIGHGRSPDWIKLRDLIEKTLKLEYDEFERVPTAGSTVVDRLKEMLDDAAIAFVVMTAEDELKDGKLQARMNVIHEVGLFQGRLGFHRAIIMLEQECEEFSNIHGLVQLRFPKGHISATFEEVRRVLGREGLITS